MKDDNRIGWLTCLTLLAALSMMAVVEAAAGTWTDPGGDVTSPNADILSGSATVFGDLVDLRVQFSAHPFPPGGPGHIFGWCFDTDRDATTGGASCSAVLGAERSFGIGDFSGTLETCDLNFTGNVPEILEAAQIWFDAGSNTLRLVFPLSLISSDPAFNYAVASSFSGSSGANEWAPDSPDFASPGGSFTSDVGEAFGGALLCPPPATTIAIDIKPGSFPNTINPSRGGIIRVAVLTTLDLDAATVDASTVRFGALGASARPMSSALQDVDGDGDQDLVLKFRTPDTGITYGTTLAFLRASTVDGHALTGSDSIRTVGCP